MRALVVYESMFGNTHAVATEIAAGLHATHEVTLVPVTRATREMVFTADLIIAGGPTHLHGMSTVASRRTAAETGRKDDSGLTLDPDADGPGLRGWLEQLRIAGVLAASFDTRLSRRREQAVMSCGKAGDMSDQPDAESIRTSLTRTKAPLLAGLARDRL